MIECLINKLMGIIGYTTMSVKNLQKLKDKKEFLPLDTVNTSRLLYLYNLFKMVEGVPGDVVECGVGHGRSFIALANIVRITNSPKNIWGFDSFEGFPAPTVEDTSIRNIGEGRYAVDENTVWNRINMYVNDAVFIRQKVTLIKGYFEKTAGDNRLKQISLLNLDVDLYQSYKVCLNKLYPKLSPGGIVTFDEYLRESIFFPGAVKAIDEFFTDKNVQFVKDQYYGKYYIVKK